MTAFRVGDIVSVEFAFSDLQTQKRRPGLVLSSGDMDLLVARITTHPPRDASDVVLTHWHATGLPRASTVRLAKLATIDRRLVAHTIGHLHAEDSRAVAQAWHQFTANVAAQLRT